MAPTIFATSPTPLPADSSFKIIASNFMLIADRCVGVAIV